MRVLLPLAEHTWEYCTWGEGKEVLLAFHGFGQSAEVFAPLAEALSATHCFYAMALPGHEQLAEAQPAWSPKALEALLEYLSQKHQVAQLHLLGFSIGAKAVIALLQAVPHRVASALLIAPEGLPENFWYKLATSTLIGRSCFKTLLRRPQWLLGLAQLLAKCRLLVQSNLLFLKTQISQAPRIVHTWLALRLLRTQKKNLKKAFALAENLPIMLLLGKRDKVVSASRVKAYLKAGPLQIVELHSTHTQLLAEVLRRKEAVFFYQHLKPSSSSAL
jgi:pimeloyl-ACP methyl ester carboxylesterase